MKKLSILLVKDGEPLPLHSNAKKLRTSLIASEMLRRGHEVTWFTSTFDHYEKSYHARSDKKISINENYTMELKYCGGYKKNLSLARVLHHWRLSRKLKKYLVKNNDFDLIICSYPPIEAAYEAVKFAKKYKIPIILDVRDKWPDTFVEYFPRKFSWLIKMLTFDMRRKAKFCFSKANQLTSISKYMSDWVLSKVNSNKTSCPVYYLGTSLDKYSPDTFSNKMINVCEEKEGLVCSWVGKGLSSFDWDVLFEAIGLVEMNINLNITGKGLLYDALEKKHKSDKANFLGILDEYHVAELLCSSDVLLLHISSSLSVPSMCNKFFDYLWAEKPLLVSVHGEMADLIRSEELGYVFEHGNAEDLAQGLRYLSNKDVRDRISKNVKRVYAEKFSISNIYPKFGELAKGMVK